MAKVRGAERVKVVPSGVGGSAGKRRAPYGQFFCLVRAFSPLESL